MPIFEYICEKCQHRFEKIIYGKSTVVQCPSCESDKLEKQLSVFAANTRNEGYNAQATSVAGCGTCGDPRGPGACSLN